MLSARFYTSTKLKGYGSLSLVVEEMVCGQWRYTARSPSSLDSKSGSFELLVRGSAHGCPPVASFDNPVNCSLIQRSEVSCAFSEPLYSC